VFGDTTPLGRVFEGFCMFVLPIYRYLSNGDIFITICTVPSCFHRHTCECFEFSSFIFKTNLNKISAQCLLGSNISYLTFA